MEPSELTPAEFEGAPRNRYRPGLPWRRIGFIVLFAALIVGAYFWRQKVRADALRERIYALHAAEVAPVLSALDTTSADLREKSLSAKGGAADRFIEAEVPLSALHDENVVYLKIRAPELRDEDSLEAAIDAEREGVTVKAEDMFGGFNPADYEHEVMERWGDTDSYREAGRRTKSYTKADWAELQRESGAILESLEDLGLAEDTLVFVSELVEDQLSVEAIQFASLPVTFLALK